MRIPIWGSPQGKSDSHPHPIPMGMGIPMGITIPTATLSLDTFINKSAYWRMFTRVSCVDAIDVGSEMIAQFPFNKKMFTKC